MPSPALIVGLGGTGTLVATYVKKDLMETQEGKWPLKEVRVLAFDTDTKQPNIGGQGQIRQAGRSTGAVRLSPGEFFFIGGNVQTLMREVASGKHSHLRNWLLADWYLGVAKLPDKAYNLNEGAGQFRQFGRLTIFKDLATPSQSTLYGALHDAFTKLKRDNPTMTSLQVFLISSLAGGTGAGMFADVAHLMRTMATQPDIDLKDKMSIRGYLVLPDAFSRTVDQAWLRSMRARAFAAMRENRRFAVSFDYERGYPMQYHEGSGNPLWQGSVKGKLFDLLYYLDGQGERNQLGLVDLKFGVAPAIAEAINSAIDSQAGGAFSAYVANVEMERLARLQRGELSPKTATFGSAGTYSIVFPIYNLMEAWTHDMGLEALNQLVMPREFDSRTGRPSKLKTNANQENPGEDGSIAARDFLKATKPVIYNYRDENNVTKTVQAEPTLLMGELARISMAAARPGSAIIQDLASRNISDWNPYFTPRGDDRETQRLMQKIENILNIRMYDREGKIGQVLATDQQKQKEDFISAYDRVVTEVRVFKNRHLGDEDAKTGQRSGGIYRTALAQIVEHHTSRFYLCLDYFIQATLNGSPNRPAVESKGGKIGFMEEFMESLFQSLEQARSTLQRVQQIRRDQGESRRNAMASAQTAAQNMKAMASKKGLFGTTNEAAQSQHAYLQSEMQLIEILQAEAAEEAILDVVNRMIDYVRSTQEAIQAWEQALAYDNEGLYGRLLRGRKQVDSDRAAGQDIKCHLVVSDPAYEKLRYDLYVKNVEGGWLNRLLGDVRWELETKMVAGRPQVDLKLIVNQNEKPVKITKELDEENLLTWLQHCRQPFAGARQSESVIGYLIQHPEYKDPTKLADVIYGNSGVSLNHEGGNPLPGNFLRAYFQTEEEAGHRTYLRNVIQHLSQRSGQGISEVVSSETGREAAQESKFVQYVNSEDRFKFSLVFTQEMLELERIAAYKTGDQAYLGGEDRQARGDRRVLHIFPAEVHAAEYEGRLPELRQEIRLFSDDVALQLEDLGQFKLFLLCYTYDLIQRGGVQIDNTGGQGSVWKLVLPPDKPYDEFGNPTSEEEIHLTSAEKTPLFPDALMTFNFIGKDARYNQGYAHSIDYNKVAATLKRVRSEDAQRRLSDGKAGQTDPLKEQLAGISDEKKRQELFLELARIDRIREKLELLETELLPNYKKHLGDPDNQKDYDIASVFALMLRDEVKSVRQVIQDQIKVLYGLGNDPKRSTPPSSGETKGW
jgi:hypothetical protein